jgi:two-component system phosphate regulon sensor histidine kinase PhoR
MDTTIHEAEGRFSPDFGRVLTFVVNDEAGREIYTHRHEGEDDSQQRQKRFLAQAPLDDVFPGWHVRITYTKPSGFAWSKRVLGVQAGLLTLAALLAVLGTVFMVRFSLRQMELSRVKTHFVSNITHELKTPLSAIRLYTETLQQGRVRDRTESDRFLGIIHKEAVRLTALINNILDFSRIEDGQRRYSFAPGSVTDVVHDVVDAYAFQMRNHGFEVQFEAAGGLPLLPIDRDAISQAVLNLIDNAVKYSPEEKHVEVTVVPEGPGVAVRVRDHGRGIPASEQAKIFEAFYRVEKGLQHDVKGSGLGLAVVQHVAEAHGGRVSVESELGAGSTFVLHLPGSGASVTTADAVPKGLATGAPWQRRSA